MFLLYDFFMEWDALEAMYPFGVIMFTPLFLDYGVSSGACLVVDEELFLDLMIPRQIDVRRIKVQSRASGHIFWVRVELSPSHAIISFQSSPSAPLMCTQSVVASPSAVIETIVAMYRRIVVPFGRGHCLPVPGRPARRA